MARLHFFWGLLFTTVFLATGMYMRARFPVAFTDDPTMRMLFRSAHVYILLSALPHYLLGVYLVLRGGRRRKLQWASSALLLASPVIFTCAFFFEPAPRRLDRPISLAGLVCALAGTLGHAAAARPEPSEPIA